MAIKSVLFQLGVITISFCDQIGQMPRHAVMVQLNFNGALEHFKNLKAIFTENIDERWTLTTSLKFCFSIGVIMNHNFEWTRTVILDGRTKRMITTKVNAITWRNILRMRYFNDISDSVEKCHKMNRFGDAFRWLNRIYKNHMILSHKLELESLLGQIHQMYVQVNVAGITSLVAVFLSKWILSSAFTLVLCL